jgi:hypothetical protein
VKVMVRAIMQFLPGKMTEGMKLLDESMALANKKYGPIPKVKKYTPWLGGVNTINTVITEMEWDSLTQMAEFFEKTMADPEMMETMPKWEAILESDKEELYMVTL